jgi:hypothetical protein
MPQQAKITLNWIPNLQGGSWMKSSVRIMGKKAIPIWLLVIALVACGAGAAAGTVLAGKVTGEVPVAVSQALLTEAPDWKDSLASDNTTQPQQVYMHATWVHAPNREFGAVADDNTAFQAAAELATGDWAVFNLPLKNASDVELIGLLTLSVPDCLEVEVFQAKSDAGGSHVHNVVRVGMNTWKFKLDAEAEYCDPDDALAILVSVDDYCMPGYYNIEGTIKQIGY